jgi:major membrane immunogen (membrane-anchored lipoprotein)
LRPDFAEHFDDLSGFGRHYAITQKGVTMKTARLISAVAFVLLYLLAGCSQSDDVPENVQTINFPANEDGKTEYSSDIFDTKFSMTVSLPEGMTVDTEQSLFPDGISGAFSNIPIVSNGNIVGCVGYNTYDIEVLSGEPKPMVIYNQISLGNHYHFTIRDKYNVVIDDAEIVAATTDVYNDLGLSADEAATYAESDYNFGVVAYSKTVTVYVAFDLDKTAFTPEQVEAIAKSISIDVG